MSLKYEIKTLTTNEILSIRQRVLKPFLNKEECLNPGDNSSTTYHRGLFHNNKLISAATFLSESHPDFSAGNPYRLRGMATEASYQSQGFGQYLLNDSFVFLKAKQCDFLWCNARIKAFGFYYKLGFCTHGPEFEIKQIGPHKVMYKRLIPR